MSQQLQGNRDLESHQPAPEHAGASMGTSASAPGAPAEALQSLWAPGMISHILSFMAIAAIIDAATLFREW